jgi:hypothetical protein
MVKLQGKSLKEAANKLGINYSTAKTILRVYRIENRILKKTPCQTKTKKLLGTQSDQEESSHFQFLDENSNSNVEKDYVHSASEDKKEGRHKDTIFKVISRENASKSSASQSNPTPPCSFLDDKAPKMNMSGHHYHSTSPISVSTPPQDEMSKSTEEFLTQFKQILGTLQFCINEVARNEITIKNICSMLGINHVGSASSFFSNPYVLNALRNYQIGGLQNNHNVQQIQQNQPLLQAFARNMNETQLNHYGQLREISNTQNPITPAPEGHVLKPIPITYSGNNFLTMNTTLLNK